MNSPSAEQLLHQLEAFNQGDLLPIPEELRAKLFAAAKITCHKLETSADTVARVLISQPVEAISVRIAADLRLFSTLANKTLSLSELAKVVGAELDLLERVLRSLTAFGALTEVSPKRFTSSPTYALFQEPSFEAAFGTCQDILQKIRGSLPGYLASTGHRNPTDPTDTAAEGFTQLPEIYSVEDRLITGFDPETAMFVDVGGGLGQKAVALKKSLPHIPGRVIVQDTPAVIRHAPKGDPSYQDVELTAHDFLTPNPIKGARCYYIRQCLRNWPDKACVTILKHLKEAATPGYSRILIHEIIVPETEVGPWVVS
ncbi:hypothetical protein MMC25_001960 [Agyrium rufum]|nr:hypothetical protein [Agyrium rufum]